MPVVDDTMTAFLVKETLRKCPSDPVRLADSAAGLADSAHRSSQQLAPVSKCVVSLDGYNYVIGTSSRCSIFWFFFVIFFLASYRGQWAVAPSDPSLLCAAVVFFSCFFFRVAAGKR